ncbi:MAG: Rv0909 family putative TA system antitoxin [Solirubrobacteraceae bacterium]
MGFGHKLKELRDQAQQAVADNREKIQGAVKEAAEVANLKTSGKYADKISNLGAKVSAGVDKIAETAPVVQPRNPGDPDGGPGNAGAEEQPDAGAAGERDTGERDTKAEGGRDADAPPDVAAPPEFE